MRETLKIMGLGRFAYIMSYLTMQGILSFLTSLVLAVAIWNPMSKNEIFVEYGGNFTDLLLALTLLGFSLISLSMVMTSIFTDSKLSAQVGPILLFFPSSLVLVVLSTSL